MLLHNVVKMKINAELAFQKKITNWEEILTVSIAVVEDIYYIYRSVTYFLIKLTSHTKMYSLI